MLKISQYCHYIYSLSRIIENSASIGFSKILPIFTPRTILLKNGLKFFNRSSNSDLFILNEIFYDECYTPDFFRINENDCVIDIGGQMGAFALYAGKKTKNRVYTFEPYEKNFQILEKNISLNGIGNIFLKKYGLGGEDAEVDFFIHPDNSGGHSIYKKYTDVSLIKTQIKIRRFNDFYIEESLDVIDFMKIDCEGAEYDIIFSIDVAKLEKIKKIVIELETFDGHSPSSIIKHLNKHHFVSFYHKGLLFAMNSKYFQND